MDQRSQCAHVSRFARDREDVDLDAPGPFAPARSGAILLPGIEALSHLPPARDDGRSTARGPPGLLAAPPASSEKGRPPMTTAILDKKADLAGPGIGKYEDLEKVLPNDYTPLLRPK